MVRIFLLIIFLSGQSPLYCQTLPKNHQSQTKIIVDSISRYHMGLNIVISLSKKREISAQIDDTARSYLLKIYKTNMLIKNIQLKVGYFGSIYIPNPQPTNIFFVFGITGEGNGEIQAIDSTGKMFNFPGYFFSIDSTQQKIYTRPIGDGGYPVASFDFKTKQIITKDYLNSPDTDPWKKGLKYYEIKKSDWLY